MINRSTLVWLGLVIAVGFVLFHIKERVQELEEHLSGLHDRITGDRDEIHALRAEWSYLNDPVRIEELARRHLPFQPVDARQVQALDHVPMRDGVTANGAAADPGGLAPIGGMVMVTEPLPASVTRPQAPVRSVMVPVPADGPVGGIGHLPEIVRATRSLLIDPARVPRVPAAARQAHPAAEHAASSQAVPSRAPASGTLRPEDMVPSTLSPPPPRPVPVQAVRPAVPAPVWQSPVQPGPVQPAPSLDRPPSGHAMRTRNVAIGPVTDAGMLWLARSRPAAPTR